MKERLIQLVNAIKMVFASVYSKAARSYFEAIDYKIEEERMAVVIQQVVGTRFDERFYPLISGVAQSYNFYPFSYIRAEDGVAMLALGLGKYVVGGERSFRFCPAYPKMEILSPEEQVRCSQKHFYGLDMRKNTYDLCVESDTTLVKLELSDAESDGVLHRIASTWNHLNQSLDPGVSGRGPRVLNFSEILLYDAFPLAKTLQTVLEVVEDSMETPVEIEFAVDLPLDRNSKPVFHLLQIKHLLRDAQDCRIEMGSLNFEDLFLYSQKGMGNGIIEEISDVVWVDPELFNKAETRKMAEEADEINDMLKASGRKYILLGPGRWGTRDPWLGIPVSWPQISHAKIIVEYALEGFQIDASLGSHFFHNVTSLNIGYFTVPLTKEHGFIDWSWLRTAPTVSRKRFFVHSRLEKPVRILMDGRKSAFAIYKQV